MALLLRILVIVVAFLLASFAAALVVTFAVVMESNQLAMLPDPGRAWAIVVFGFIVSGMGFVPAMLVVALAEALRIRSVLFYAIAGGAGLVALYYGLGYADHAAGGVPVQRELEIMAGAGIAAGFVYWMIAGRNAGVWRTPPAPPPAGATPA